MPVIVTSSVTRRRARRARRASCCAASRCERPRAAARTPTAGRADPTSWPSTACSVPPPTRGYQVERTGERSYRVSGAGVERLLARYDLDNEEALAHLERRLRGIGVIRALEAEGFEPGDDVEIAGRGVRTRPGRVRIASGRPADQDRDETGGGSDALEQSSCGIVAGRWRAAALSASAAGAQVLRVGTYHGIRGQFTSIQAAVDAAKPGDWILVGPGDYKTHVRARAPDGHRGDCPPAC